MSRFLFVVPPLTGHINPVVGTAAELVRRGHQVAWAGVSQIVRPLAGEPVTVFPCAGPIPGQGEALRPSGLRGPAALKVLWEQFLIPLADAMAPDIHNAVEVFQPDVIIADQQAFAGGLVAERLGLPWATSATTSAEFSDSLRGIPKVEKWLSALLADLRRRIGNPTSNVDPRFSPHLILAFTTRELAGTPVLPGSDDVVHFVGPSISSRPAEPDFPWQWLDPARRAVLVTLGTVNDDAGPHFLAKCVDLAKERRNRLQAIIVDPGSVLGTEFQMTPKDRDVLVRKHIPQLALLQRVAAVVCHGGHNTVCEALWHGLPLVVAPIRDDQTIVAGQVAAAGVGIRVRFGWSSAAKLGAAVDSVLTDPSYRAAAEKIRVGFQAAGGAFTAANHLEHLVVRDDR